MKIFILLLLFLSRPFIIGAHEGHEEVQGSWSQWIGSFHLIFLHYPIALINVLAVSEILLTWTKKPLFDYASRFLLPLIAILSLPTAILGFIYSTSAPYEGSMETLLLRHMWLGFATAALSIILALIRKGQSTSRGYYAGLTLLVLLVNLAAYYGGEMAFG